MNYTINISLPKKLADLAKAQVDAGYYSSMSEILRDSLRGLLAKPKLPVYSMSPKAEKISIKAMKEHKEGKSILMKDVHDLDSL